MAFVSFSPSATESWSVWAKQESRSVWTTSIDDTSATVSQRSLPSSSSLGAVDSLGRSEVLNAAFMLTALSVIMKVILSVIWYWVKHSSYLSYILEAVWLPKKEQEMSQCHNTLDVLWLPKEDQMSAISTTHIQSIEIFGLSDLHCKLMMTIRIKGNFILMQTNIYSEAHLSSKSLDSLANGVSCAR